MKINDLVRGAMLEIGALEAGEDPTPSEYEDILQKLNAMLGRWGTKHILIPASVSESFSLSAGTASYTMGSGGTASSVRAMKILDTAYIRDSGNVDYRVRVISESEYNDLSIKGLQSRPQKLYYDQGYPTGTIYFYPTPDATETAYINSLKPLSEIALSGITDDFNLGREYEEAIQLNLAIRIAPMFGERVTQELILFADEALEDLEVLNLSNKVRRVARTDPGLPGVVGQRYDINAG